ncbi:protein PAF1 homolog [Cucurbita pepo subsp. pepo]|uniref:protein PAF1 homolog n=1 Tax=Cucurbita pepo subsp. pepo TaxID=3664 RepID=UPI000C9D4A3B|nr:protein PAF1 homolog [Cucurbita pepo subsp. pepo]
MASYRPYPPQSSFGPSPGQNPIPPPPAPPAASVPTQQRGGSQYNQNWGGYGGDGSVPPPASSSSYPQNYNQVHQSSNFHQQHYGPPRSQQPPPPPPPHQSYPYAPQPPPPPPPDSSYPPPPPPPASSQPSQHYFPPSQYPQGNQNQQSIQPPPPPPSSPPPSSSIPPPPPPNSPPPPSAPQPKTEGSSVGAHERDKGVSKDPSYGRRERENSNHDKHQRHSGPPMPPKKSNGPSGRIETDDEKRQRKKREFEKQRQDERHRHHLKESQNTILQKTQMLSTGKGHGSIVGSRMGERKATPFLSGERIENRLKKPTTFLCKLKFRNELPDTSAQPKLMSLRKEKDHYTRYTITSLEKTYKPQLYVEPDLGIPLDLLDLSVYNPPSVRIPLAPEDEELLRDDVLKTPVKKDGGIKRKERPTDKGVAWLVKTQYISPLSIESTKQSLTEKQAKELREMKGGRNILENLNNRERKIKEIDASFEACKSRPVHATNKNLYPVEVLPLLPDFDRYDDPFVVVAFDNAPTADSETFNKLDQSIRDAHESQAIMKSYMATGSDPSKPEKFLAYMVPSPDELSKDIYDEQEDVSYSWVREYHWDVRGDNVDDPTTYLVSFDDAEARYVPLPTKLVLRKKRAKEGRSNDEVEHFPAPARVTVRRRPTVATLEVKDPGVYSNLKRGSDIEDGLGRSHKHDRHQDMDQYSGAEDDMSD